MIESLHPDMKKLCLQHIENCKSRNVNLGFLELFTLPEPLETFSQYGFAYNAIPLLKNKTMDCSKSDYDSWLIMYDEGRKLGLILGHDFKKKIDTYFQIPDITIEQLKNKTFEI